MPNVAESSTLRVDAVILYIQRLSALQSEKRSVKFKSHITERFITYTHRRTVHMGLGGQPPPPVFFKNLQTGPLSFLKIYKRAPRLKKMFSPYAHAYTRTYKTGLHIIHMSFDKFINMRTAELILSLLRIMCKTPCCGRESS